MVDASESRKPLTPSLLHAYYAYVTPFLDYLLNILEPFSASEGTVEKALHNHILRHDDTDAYKHLLLHSYIATGPVSGNTVPTHKIFEPMVHMLEVIDRAQSRLFLRENGKPSNIITLGYRSAERRGEHGKDGGSRSGISNYFVNTIITALQAPEWELLLTRVGEDPIYHLLTDTSVYVSLPNECLCQLTGPPLVHIKPPLHGIPHRNDKEIENGTKTVALHSDGKRKSDICEFGPQRKRRKTTSIGASDVLNAVQSLGARTLTRRPITRSPADILFARVRLFYSRPSIEPKTHYISVGLPHAHVLNRLTNSLPVKPVATAARFDDLDSRENAAKARHLSKYIFPRQYGLESAFTTPFQSMRSQASAIKDFTDRENEIKIKGPCKTPKRLKHVLDLLEMTLRRHGKCGYKPLCDKICPSKLKTEQSASLDSSVILELISEQSIQLKSQQCNRTNSSLFSDMSAISAHGQSMAEAAIKHKPKFAEFMCSHAEVYLYVRLVTKLVIPKAFWGSHRNWKVVLKYIKCFIGSRRYETLTLHGVLQNFSTADCDWLLPQTKAALAQRQSVAESLKRRELLEEFLYWYFESFLIPLLKTTFYITESSAFRNKILYFRQDDWESLCQPLLDRLTVNTFQKINQHDAEQLLQHRKLGYSFVRLLPKDTGVRPVVNLRRRKKKGATENIYDQSQSINQILQAAFQILTYEKEMQPKLLGASVFGPNETYLKLKAFKARMIDQHGRLPKLYFVKVDVQACFDTIEQDKLLKILKHLISEEAYMIQRYGQVASVAGRIKRTYARKAGPECEHPHFLTFATRLASLLRHAVFVDQVVYPFAYRDDIMDLLEDHITANIVKIGQEYYRQTVGIPQGSVLSTLLCSFFYGDLENTVLKFAKEDASGVLLRLIDDYLFITTELSHARRFLEMMNKGHPEYGCFISKDKTLANFDYGTQLMDETLSKQNLFAWCGYLLNMSDLSVSTDYSRFHETYLRDSLTVDRGRRPGAAFTYKMLQLAKQKSHIIYCDTTLNTQDIVHKNIYQNFVLSAMKMHHYIRDWGLNAVKDVKILRDTVRQVIKYTYATIRNKASNQVASRGGGKCDIKRSTVLWLGTHAFHTVLSQKPTAYKKLMKSLEFDLSLPQYRDMRRRFKVLTRESLEGMSVLSF